MTDAHYLPPPIWVDKAAAFQAMLAHLKGQAALAVDTESNSLYAYQEQVCLIQISVPGVDYLVDPLALPDLSGLGPLLADPGILKVFHGAEYDLTVLYRDLGFVTANLFDTMWASRILGWPAHGLAALLQTHFGVVLNKKYQRANWGLRPLPPEQLNYARLDSHFLLPLHDIQVQELQATKRWPQARHRFEKLVQMRCEPKDFDPEGFWHLSGVRSLDDEGRGALRELYLFRERRAQAENRPRFKVLSNKTLLTLSAERPENAKALQHIRGISDRLVQRHGYELLAAIRRGALEPLGWEQRPRSGNDPAHGLNGRPSPACQARFEALRVWRNSAAEARGVEPDIVLNNSTLWAIAQRDPRDHTDLARDGLLAGWQVEEFGQDLLAVVRRIQNRHRVSG
jgi:ribonuclease D